MDSKIKMERDSRLRILEEVDQESITIDLSRNRNRDPTLLSISDEGNPKKRA